jgi:hypothetical protein
MVRSVNPMPTRLKILLPSLAVMAVLTVGFSASALAGSRVDGNGDISVLAPKPSHKPKPGTTPIPTPTPTPTRRPVATPKPTAKPIVQATPVPATPKPRPRPTPAPTAQVVSPSPSLASQAAALTTGGRGGAGRQVSVLSIEQEPLRIAMGIVVAAGLLLLGTWLLAGQRSSRGKSDRAGEPPAPEPDPSMAPEAAPTESLLTQRATPAAADGAGLAAADGAALAEAAGPPRRRGLRKAKAASAGKSTGRRGRVKRLDEVFATSAMRRVVVGENVELLNVPHELYGIPLTDIAIGREVELVEEQAPWAKIRTPWGAEGWVRSTSLGA